MTYKRFLMTSAGTIFLLSLVISANAISFRKGRRKRGATRGLKRGATQVIKEDEDALVAEQHAKRKQSDLTLREGLPEKLPFAGIGYLGTGYNIFDGNPVGDDEQARDPGFRGPVIHLEWSQEARHATRDMQKLLPTQGWGYPKVSCKYASTATEVSSMQDYKDSLKSNAKVHGGVSASYSGFGVSVSASASFSNSKGVSSFRNDVLKGKKEQFQMVSYCVQYFQQLHSPAKILNTTAYFNTRVASLPLVPTIIIGDCANFLCTNLYMESLKKYIGVSGSKVVLQEKPPKGRWLFDRHEHVYWVTSETKWKIDRTKTLTREGDQAVIKPEIKKGKQKRKHQLWRYFTNTMFLSAEASDDDADAQDKLVAFGLTEKGKEKGKEGTLHLSIVEEIKAQRIVRNYYEAKVEWAWSDFFSEFGTHFVHSLELGGRMITTITMSKSDVSSLKKLGVDMKSAVAAEMSGSGWGVSVSGSYSKDTAEKREQEAKNAMGQSSKEYRTFVLGGDPPNEPSKENLFGFGEWAKTVENKPMPVRYTLMPLAETKPFQCKECEQRRSTLAAMMFNLNNGVLRSFSRSNLDLFSGKRSLAEKTYWTRGQHPCPDRLTHEGLTLDFNCRGYLLLTDEEGDELWKSGDGLQHCGPSTTFLEIEFIPKVRTTLRIKCNSMVAWEVPMATCEKADILQIGTDIRLTWGLDLEVVQRAKNTPASTAWDHNDAHENLWGIGVYHEKGDYHGGYLNDEICNVKDADEDDEDADDW